MSTFEAALPTILRHEGGIVNNPHDSGGATNFGVSLRFLKEMGVDLNEDGEIDIADVKGMTVVEATAIYQGLWDLANLFNVNDQTVATKVFDTAINTNSKRAIKMLQRAVNALGKTCSVDGFLGFETAGLVNGLDSTKLYSRLREQQAAYYTSLYNSNPAKFGEFIDGWLNRAYDRI